MRIDVAGVRLAGTAPAGRAAGQRGFSSSTAARAAALSVYQIASTAVYFAHSAGSDSSGKIALTGHSGSHAPQSMHSFGSMNSLRSDALVVMDAIDRTDGDARQVEHVDARLGDDVGHSGSSSRLDGRRIRAVTQGERTTRRSASR